MNKKNKILIISLFLLLALLLGISINWYYKKNIQSLVNNIVKSHAACLNDGEIADYPIDEKMNPVLKIPKEVPVVISIRDKKTLEEKFSFQIDNIFKNYRPIETHRCGIYVIKVFNYDPKKSEQDPGYKDELWRYNYGGKGEKLILLSEKPKEFISYYSPDFRIDPTENYAVLEKGYLGKDDYALVIKNLKTKEDVFVLSLKEITDKYPVFEGSIGMNDWTKDSKYFWANIFDGPDVLAFFRIEAGTWKWEIFRAPDGAMGGDALNPELGYVTYDSGAPWTGFHEISEQYKEEWQKQGKITSFYLYSLFTKKQILLATSTDPTWNFQPKWLSDTQLEYEMPSGEKRIYESK